MPATDLNKLFLIGKLKLGMTPILLVPACFAGLVPEQFFREKFLQKFSRVTVNRNEQLEEFLVGPVSTLNSC